MTPDAAFILAKVAQFNELCFGGALPPIEVKMTRARTFLGKVTYKNARGLFGKATDFTLRISTSYDLPEREWEDVVIHELIHYHIALNGIRDTSSHGKVFRKMMAEINSKHGRNITMRHRNGVGLKAAATPRKNFVCVSLLHDGKWGVTVCNAPMALKLHRALPRHYRLQKMVWYSSTDPFFDSYPHSRTPKIYKITKAELDAHLADAQMYSCNGKVFVPLY